MADESRQLVLRASRGDALAVDELLERHLPGLRAYVRKNISPTLLAKESGSDVVQSVCREVLEAVDRFRYEGEAAFRAWLYQMALRKLVDRLRYHNAQKRDANRQSGSTHVDEIALLASSIRSPSKDAMLREEMQALERGFEKLSDADRDILRMIYIEGKTHAQVAEQLECSEAASRKQLSRALARLSRLIG
jgi:RNA polymerase sigma-70 factor (ECF subfamily)